MAINKEKKKDILSKLKDILGNAKSVTFVNFHGISVPDINEMRGGLKEKGVGYYVAKKTLVRKALDETKIEGELPELGGELALAYSREDETAPARAIYEFQKRFKETLGILGGIFGGVYQSQNQMTEIAAIPSIQILRGMFLNVINSPIQGLVIALDEISKGREK
ncbi:50S ribosomal protein L10 [Candidatus Campbellbacteria bacterium CG11_big_fil_rev_8_21_14_0_20_44_21]|uniref:Large ribosomal subunit protein uL10 n=1 Tax=Candidatus Campbellbacteria bacterium CG22_combo_CG10-13_8_21_14_all_43_18 TaxID=1974530 RepID=A0A2H0DWZ3_9BACT|nr:MAG: 50S ribosomal protein L10 [Candidatus Campbellbacteria bacterium CG22_combo_CG10-13_8_21_14_all_43_18]PIR24325.1 MAG: 50S ribosomal protein L10 [Candidatus Campbellbacteria bacterium CG11_big_fil_rev_8_21_14_0_20_44_21]